MDPSKRKTVSQRCPQRLSRSAVRTTGRQRYPQRQPLSTFNTARAMEAQGSVQKRTTVSQCFPQRRLSSRSNRPSALPAAKASQRFQHSECNESIWIRPAASAARTDSFSALSTRQGLKAYGSVQKERQYLNAARSDVSYRLPQLQAFSAARGESLSALSTRRVQ
jgi:hypothetical protein